ncbi:MAG: CBS domain-containing protein, partial [Pirellulales bacterium]|nr:CBS domain-containing protein [Pirellulales bacterium]
VVDVLEQIRVEEVMDTQRRLDLVPEDLPLRQILHLAAYSSNTYFPVVNRAGELVGIFSLRDLRSVLTGDGSGPLVVAADLATAPVLTVTPQDELHTALRRFTQKNIDELPVVSPDDANKVVGVLSRRNVIAAYHQRTMALRHEQRA